MELVVVRVEINDSGETTSRSMSNRFQERGAHHKARCLGIGIAFVTQDRRLYLADGWRDVLFSVLCIPNNIC